jgi:hypothetical protein
MIITIIFWWIAHRRLLNNDKKEELEKVDVSIDKTSTDL